jgi:hypothetical protein
MPRIPFDQLEFQPQKRHKNQGFTRKENTGLDTETYHGYVKLICDDTGRWKDIECFQDILFFLIDGRYRNRFNWFYNIQFDFESIVKHLPEEDLINLYIEKELNYGGYHISYIPKKFFAIRDLQRHYYYFYDLFSFLDTSLNTASKKFLHDQKIDTINSALLNTDWYYWTQNYKEIVKYCIYDASLTKRLADYFWSIIYNRMNYAPHRPFSKGKLSEEYFLHTCYIPTINDIPKMVLRYAYENYTGGRFEILKRGYFEKVYSYDIKSAYPHVMRNLIDFSLGEWDTVTKETSNPYVGFYNCEVICNEDVVSPFCKKIHKILNIYPNGIFPIYLNSHEIEFINKNFPSIEITIRNGYEFYPDRLEYPFKEEIERLYKWKESEPDPDIKYAVKILLNSLYGKTIQAVGGRTGKIFNPIYATLITSDTRISLLKQALKNFDKIIAFSTDSVSSTTKLKSPKNPQLGDFSLDFEGSGVYVMSDIYTLWNKQKFKNKFRGFSLVSEKDRNEVEEIPLTKILNSISNSTIYTYKTNRVYHLGECIRHTRTRDIKDINIFDTTIKTLNINNDSKRIWERDFKHGKDVLTSQINSIPLLL